MRAWLLRLFMASAIGTIVVTPQPVAAQDTGQVTRPLSEPTLNTNRLPAPKPSARQGADGKITVSWAPIEGAASYRMWRSVPPTPQAAVTLQNPQATSYVDEDIKAGSTYYYLVAAVNTGGIDGLRGATAPVTATTAASTSVTTPPTVKGSVTQQETLRISLEFSAPDAVAYEIRRTVYLSSYDDPSRIDYSRASDTALLTTVTTRSWTDTSLRPQPLLRQFTYTVTARSATGSTSPPGRVDLIIPAATTSTTGSSTPPPSVSAYVAQQDPPRVNLSFSAQDAVRHEIQRVVYSSPSAEPSQINYTVAEGPVTLAATDIRSAVDGLLSQPYARLVSYSVTAVTATGVKSPPGRAELIVPAAITGATETGDTTSGGTTGGGTTYTTGPSPAGTTLTAVAAVTLAIGATTPLGSTVGSAARWLSLDDAIATVNASGTVTARASGTTQVLAASSTADGSVRVAAIQVTVK